MKDKNKLTLIEGVFSKEEAREILMNIFSTKIKFHELKNFSSQERFGKDDDTALHRIPELKKCIHTIEEIISKVENKKLIINAEVTISFSNE